MAMRGNKCAVFDFNVYVQFGGDTQAGGFFGEKSELFRLGVNHIR